MAEAANATSGIRESLAAYVHALGRSAWLIGVGVLLVIVQTVAAIAGIAALSPWWTIAPLLISVPVASFVVFHKQRRQLIGRDLVHITSTCRVVWKPYFDGDRSSKLFDAQVVFHLHNRSVSRSRPLEFTIYIPFKIHVFGCDELRVVKLPLSDYREADNVHHIGPWYELKPTENIAMPIRAFVPVEDASQLAHAIVERVYVSVRDMSDPTMPAVWLSTSDTSVDI